MPRNHVVCETDDEHQRNDDDGRNRGVVVAYGAAPEGECVSGQANPTQRPCVSGLAPVALEKNVHAPRRRGSRRKQSITGRVVAHSRQNASVYHGTRPDQLIRVLWRGASDIGALPGAASDMIARTHSASHARAQPPPLHRTHAELAVT
eukprot:3414032-Rhodomonas_salina.1